MTILCHVGIFLVLAAFGMTILAMYHRAMESRANRKSNSVPFDGMDGWLGKIVLHSIMELLWNET